MNDDLTIPGVFSDIANAIREKNGETNKILPKNMPDKIRAITTGATIHTPDGWKGTPIPTEGYIDRVYFNTDMSVDEVVAIFDTVDVVEVETDVYITMFFYDKIFNDDIYEEYKLCLHKVVNDSGTSYALIGYTHEDEFPMFKIGSYFEDDYVGWNPDMPNPVRFNVNNNINTMSPIPGLIVDNKKVSSIMSVTPFEFVNGETIALEGEYRGITIDVTENTTIDIRSLIETYKEIPLYININVKTNDEPEEPINWEYPVQNGEELTITQAYSLTQQDNTLEVE